MSSQKIWIIMTKITNLLASPIKPILNLLKLIWKIIYSILHLIYSLIITFNTYLFPQPQKQNKSVSFITKIKFLFNTIVEKYHNCKLSNIQEKITHYFKSLQTSIPKHLSLLFPKRIKFQKKILQEMSLQRMKKSSNQVLVDIKITQKRDDKKLDINSKRKQSRTYYVPTYLRVKVKNFTAIDLDKLEAQVNVDIIITFVYGNDQLIKIPRQVVNRLYNEIVLNFQRDDPLKLDENDSVHISTKQQQSKCNISFTVRKKLHMRIQSRVYYTPFERLYLILPITIQQLTPTTIVSKQINQKTDKLQQISYQASIKFNYMDNKSPFVNLDFTDQKHFGYYSLIQTGLKTLYSNKRITSIEEFEKKQQKQNIQLSQKLNKTQNQLKQNIIKQKQNRNSLIQQQNQQKQLLISKNKTNNKIKTKQTIKSQQQKQKEKKIFQVNPFKTNQNNKKLKQTDKKQQYKYFQYSFFKIPIYKHPMASLVMIFLPLWTLALLNLGIFFQQNSLSQRIASIASLMIAFIALNQTIRSQIPPHPKVVFVQLLVYAQIIASFFCLCDSFDVNKLQDYHMQWKTNKMFLSALGIFLVEVLIIIVMGLYHYYVSIPSYELNEVKPKVEKFNSRVWSNKQCDKHFERLIVETNKIVLTHKGLTQTKKLKDIHQQIKGNSQRQIYNEQGIINAIINQRISSMSKQHKHTQHKQNKQHKEYIQYKQQRQNKQHNYHKQKQQYESVNKNQCKQEINKQPVSLLQLIMK